MSAWTEKENLDRKVIDAGVVILRTSGCSHFHEGGCTMCGYNIESMREIKPTDISKQFERATQGLPDISFLKIYTSGSFLDESEVPRDQANSIMRYCTERGLRLLFESRPEYVTEQRIQESLAIHDDLEVAIGLESSNDKVLRYSINKGFAVRDYERAAAVLGRLQVPLRTYVLLKPPFLTEQEAVADAIETVKFASKTSSAVSLNPVNVQVGTLVEKLWRDWAYRPPWLWSVLEVLRSSSGLCKKIVCDPTGGGKERGPHNCGKCDDVILSSIKAYSLMQDASRLGSPYCDCKKVWHAVMDTEGFVMGGTADLQRFFRKHRA